MYMSGVRIGSGVIRREVRQILRGLRRALFACFVGAVGTILPGSCVWLTVAGSGRLPRSTSWDSASVLSATQCHKGHWILYIPDPTQMVWGKNGSATAGLVV